MPLMMVWPASVIDRDAEGRILLREAIERDAHLLLVGLGLGLDRDLDDGIGEFHALEDDRLGRIAQRVAGRRVLQARERDDVAGIGLLDVLAVIGVHRAACGRCAPSCPSPSSRSVVPVRACPNRCARR